MTKQCRTCVKDLPESSFHKDASRKGGLKYSCKSCSCLRDKKFRDSMDADERRRRNRESNLQQAYGLTTEACDDLVSSQEGRCAICTVVLSTTTKGPCVDHNHNTGEVRGILCSNCNRGIGLLNDNPALLISAAEYLNANGHYARTAP
jgi:hypothetical protein